MRDMILGAPPFRVQNRRRGKYTVERRAGTDNDAIAFLIPKLLSQVDPGAKAMTLSRMQDVSSDVVIQIRGYPSIRGALAFRRVSSSPQCKRRSLSELTALETCKYAFTMPHVKILWISLSTTHVTTREIPFQNDYRVNQMSTLEIAIREALDRDHRLHFPSYFGDYKPKGQMSWQTESSSAISKIHFVPDPSGRKGRCIVAVSKGIWCSINLWDIQDLCRGGDP